MGHFRALTSSRPVCARRLGAQMLGTIVGSIILTSSVPLPTNGPTMFVLGGILLMMVNTFALLALWHRRWQWLLISEGIFAFL
eukprot:COSAG02_NODE_33175_length_504_cov_0.876543_1_plen_82_part_10